MLCCHVYGCDIELDSMGPAVCVCLLQHTKKTAPPLQVLAAAGQVECEALQWTKCQKFALIVFGFIGTLYSNVTSLKVCGLLTRHCQVIGCSPCISKPQRASIV